MQKQSTKSKRLRGNLQCPAERTHISTTHPIVCAHLCRFFDHYFWEFPALLNLYFWLSLHQAISLNILSSKDTFSLMLEVH